MNREEVRAALNALAAAASLQLKKSETVEDQAYFKGARDSCAVINSRLFQNDINASVELMAPSEAIDLAAELGVKTPQDPVFPNELPILDISEETMAFKPAEATEPDKHDEAAMYFDNELPADRDKVLVYLQEIAEHLNHIANSADSINQAMAETVVPHIEKSNG